MAEQPGKYLKRIPDGAIYPWSEMRAAKPNFEEYIVPEPGGGVRAPAETVAAPEPVAPSIDPSVDETASEASENVILKANGEPYATQQAALMAIGSREDCDRDTHEVRAYGDGFAIFRKG